MKCIFAQGGVYISSDGDVRPCCANINHGNLSDRDSLVDIFSGTKANALRSAMLEDRIDDLPQSCPNCINLMRHPDGASEVFGMAGERNDRAPVFFDNAATVREAFFAGKTLEPGTAPLQMIVQLGELCNIQCIMCPQDHRSKDRLKPEHVAKIKNALPWINYITFSGGEPLAFDEMWDILSEYQKHPQPKYVTILTNGRLLTPERLRKHAMGIDRMSFGVNIDAATKATYEKIRDGASWDILMRNLRNYLAFIKDEGKTQWGLSFGFTIMRSNYSEIRAAIELVHDLGGGGISFGPMTGDWHPKKNCHTYLEENIFCFPHLGYERERLHGELLELSTYARSFGATWKESANTLAGVANYAMTAKHVVFDAADAKAAALLDDETLSDWMRRNVKNGPYRLAELIRDLKAGAVEEKDEKINQILTSRSWRMTAPLRSAVDIARRQFRA